MKSKHPRQIEHVCVATGILKRKEVRRLCLLGKVLRNGKRCSAKGFLEPGDKLMIRDAIYQLVAGGRDRLGLHKVTDSPRKITGPIKVHCGFHKCLTMYSRKIYRRASTALTLSPAFFKKGSTGFRHYFHRKDTWLDNCHRFGISSLSGHSLDLNQFEDIQVVRFIRDPRDLIISGYFYHKRAGEQWCKYEDPNEVDYEVVNGVVPSTLPAGQSLTGYLNEVSVEEGLAAEIEFRKRHLESMMEWPEEDERVLTCRYEDILGNEGEAFEKVFSFFKQADWIVKKARKDAEQYRAGGKEAVKGHARDPKTQQWRELFSPELNKKFVETYEPLLKRYGYPLD